MASQMVDSRLPAPPLQKQQPAGQGASDGSQARAWEREMERAQMELWLSNGIVGYKALAGEASSPSVGTVDTAHRSATANGDRLHTPAVSVGAMDPAKAGVLTTSPAKPARQPPSADRAHGVQNQPPADPVRADSGAIQPTTQPNVAPEARVPGDLWPVAPGTAQETEPALKPPPASRWPTARDLVEITGANQPWEAKPYVQDAGSSESRAIAHTTELGATLRPIAAVELSTALDGVALHMTLAADNALPAPSISAPLPVSGATLSAAASPSTSVLNLPVLPASANGTVAPPVAAYQPPIAGTVSTSRQTQAAAPERSRTAGARPHALREEMPIRLHADWSDNGVKLWLGIHPEMLPQLQAIANHLQRWISAQGFRLLALSCNGRELESTRSVADLFEASNQDAARATHPRPRELS